jgi:hypothetical protein
MHPEIVSDKPGKCPKCGMNLVLKKEDGLKIHGSNGTQIGAHSTGDTGLGSLTWKSYLPLIVIISLIFVASIAALWPGPFSASGFILNFMTGFFLVFAGFKLMDLKGFAEGYSTYDLLASRVKVYGYIYPFIELTFGLLMLAGYHPAWLLWTEFAVMMFSGIGVAIKLIKREPFMCACLGTFLKIPLTKVTLIEDFGMAALALALLFM